MNSNGNIVGGFETMDGVDLQLAQIKDTMTVRYQAVVTDDGNEQNYVQTEPNWK